MKLDRNINVDQQGKYAVVKLRAVNALPDTEAAPVAEAIAVLQNAGVLTFGYEGTADEFFVLMLKDKFAGGALVQYATNAYPDDPEYAQEVMALSRRAGSNSPFRKSPD